jgi:hypothetical protein
VTPLFPLRSSVATFFAANDSATRFDDAAPFDDAARW